MLVCAVRKAGAWRGGHMEDIMTSPAGLGTWILSVHLWIHKDLRSLLLILFGRVFTRNSDTSFSL